MKKTFIFTSSLLLVACAQPIREPLRIPSMEYANSIRGNQIPQSVQYGAALVTGMRAKAQNALFRANKDPHVTQISDAGDTLEPLSDSTSSLEDKQKSIDDVQVVPSRSPLTRDYLGPLSLGDPGVSASLWREGRDMSLVRDYRAFQPYDLITISVVEKSEGSKEADTEIKQDSSFSATIKKLLGLEDYFKTINKNLDPNNPLIDATLASSYKSEGETTRKGNLKAKISAMVMEVLPSGILRVEGEKIISVNNEDEIMVISGLIRPEDVSSDNEVDSSKVANVRVDYFGKGSVGNAQSGGWLGNIIRSLWPL